MSGIQTVKLYIQTNGVKTEFFTGYLGTVELTGVIFRQAYPIFRVSSYSTVSTVSTTSPPTFSPSLGDIHFYNVPIESDQNSLIANPQVLLILIWNVSSYIQLTGSGSADTYTYMITPTSNPISNICFPKGTLINCNQGEIPIEQIDSNFHTIRDKQIVAITKTNSTSKYLICFEKDSLGHNIPSKKTIMSENHKLYCNGKMIKAVHFVDKFEKVNKIKYTGETLYNVLMENHDKMIVNNLICETLHPENIIAKIHFILKNLNPTEQTKFIQEYNRKYQAKSANKSLRKMLIY
jgi:hypothetical protein